MPVAIKDKICTALSSRFSDASSLSEAKVYCWFLIRNDFRRSVLVNGNQSERWQLVPGCRSADTHICFHMVYLVLQYEAPFKVLTTNIQAVFPRDLFAVFAELI
jgi:hypothetical protein